MCLVIAVACGGRSGEPQAERRFSSAQSIALPNPVPAVPVYRVDLQKKPDHVRLHKLAKRPAIAVVATVATKTMRLVEPVERRIDVASIDPLAFRSVAPWATRDAQFVWSSLVAGDAVVTFQGAKRLGLKGRENLEFSGGPSAHVGAYADTGAPEIAEVVTARGTKLGRAAGPPDALIVGATPGGSVESIRRAILDRFPHARLDRLVPKPPSEPAPQPVGIVENDVFGTMVFRIRRDGFIDPDPAWVAANIASGEVPVLGVVRCHRVMFGQLIAALSEIERKGLAKKINPRDYGGCYVPRFIDRDVSKPLSMHAFGLAVDLNVSHNYLGTRGDMDPRIVAIFERWGFEWGGRWDRPDPMHFELDRLLEL